MKTAAEYAEAILREVHADMDEGIMPRDVASFSHMHNFLDANEYLFPLMEDWDTEHGVHDAVPSAATLSSVQDYTCAVCGQLVYLFQPSVNGTPLGEPMWLHVEDQPSYFGDEAANQLTNHASDLVDAALRAEAEAIWKGKGLPGIIATALAEHDTRAGEGYMMVTATVPDARYGVSGRHLIQPVVPDPRDGKTVLHVYHWQHTGRHDLTIEIREKLEYQEEHCGN